MKAIEMTKGDEDLEKFVFEKEHEKFKSSRSTLLC